MSIFVVGINYKTASIALREKAYFPLDKLSLYLQDLKNRSVANEAVLISTCNRSELYCETDDVSAACDWFAEHVSLTRAELESALYVYRDEDALAHIMRVACGLDSMVLGEPQILGQVKEAFSEGCTAGSVDAVFHRLFQQIFSVAKEIRTTTAIGACPVSVASAAIHFVRQILPDLSNANVTFIGAGDTTALMLRYLQTHLQQPITLVNRSLEKAETLIEGVAGRVYGMDKLTTALIEADIVFSATSSALPIVTKEIMAAVMQARGNKPILFVDIAVPRDIDPAVSELAGVQLFCIDDLKTIIEKNRQGREHAAEKANELIHEKSSVFFAELKNIDKVAHTIRAYRGQIEEICRAELMKAKLQLHQGIDAEAVLEAFSMAYTKKLLHSPSVQLRQAGAEGRFELLKFAKQLFAIPDPEVEASL
jgi:glutamyl-tRNA reductase